MTSKLPGPESGGLDWHVGKTPEKSLIPPPPTRKDTKKDLPASIAGSVGQPSTDSTKLSPLKNRVSVASEHIENMAGLFNSASALKHMSAGHPLDPFNPKADNANDVYMTNFAVQNQKNLDIVFKPGTAAATRSKICFGLTQIFNRLENVIVAAKSGQATVISKEDYKVERVKIYNPSTNSAYLVEKQLVDNHIKLKDKIQTGDKIEGKTENEPVELTPVEGHPGFYLMNAIPTKAAGEDEMKATDEDEGDVSGDESSISEDEDFSSEEAAHNEDDWDIDASDDEDLFKTLQQSFVQNTIANSNPSIQKKSVKVEEPLEKAPIEDIEVEEQLEKNPIKDVYVMRISTSAPTKIDSLVENNAAWIQVSNGEENYLAPGDEVLEVTEDNEVNYVTINDAQYSLTIDEDNNFKLIPAEGSVGSTDELESKYQLLESNGEKVLAPKAACLPYEEGDESIVCEGKTYNVEMGEEDGTLLLQSNEEVTFIEIDQNDWLEEEAITTKDGNDYVKRNNQDYQVETGNGNFQVVGKNIDGMVQLKVENTFQKPIGQTKPLSLLDPSKEREEFYRRIDMPSFTQAFIATVLLRPQDGKIVDLGESNVLFQAMPDENGTIDPMNPNCKLRPVIIDLDETMPPANDYTQDPDFVKPGEKTTIHAVRNGLIGFPQARKILTGEDKLEARKNLEEIVAKKELAGQFLNRFMKKGGTSSAFNQHHVDAYNGVVDKMEKFLKNVGDNDWSLEQLFFFTFPEYEQQWSALGDLGPERKAMHIGKDSLEDAIRVNTRKF